MSEREELKRMADEGDIAALLSAGLLFLDCCDIAEARAKEVECKECPKLRADLMSATRQYHELWAEYDNFIRTGERKSTRNMP